jgi:hypothetical protein
MYIRWKWPIGLMLCAWLIGGLFSCLVVPFHIKTSTGHTLRASYGFIFDPPAVGALHGTIDIATLFVTWCLVILAGVLLGVASAGVLWLADTEAASRNRIH